MWAASEDTLCGKIAFACESRRGAHFRDWSTPLSQTEFDRAVSTAVQRLSRIEDSKDQWLSGKSPSALLSCLIFARKRSQTKRSRACYDEDAATPAYLVACPDSLSLSLFISLSLSFSRSLSLPLFPSFPPYLSLSQTLPLKVVRVPPLVVVP